MATDSSRTKVIPYPVRLFLWLLGYSLLLVGCFIFFQYNREKDFKATELHSQLQLVNRFIIDGLSQGKNIDTIVHDGIHPFDTLRVSVIDKAGYVVYDNAMDSLPRINHLGRDEVRSALAKGSGFAVHRVSESNGGTYFYSATRGADGTIVRTAIPYSVSLDTLLHADYGFIWVMGCITLVMCVIGYFTTRRIGDHIVRLNRFAENVERGVRMSDTAPFPEDELGSISNHIIRLYVNLQQAVSDRDREHRAAMREQQEKERIKKQLTNNINHELKTPVAAIQVCIETMLEHPDMNEAKRREFLDRTMANCLRLKQLLSDVSLITRMDDGVGAIVREPVDLAEIIASAVAEKSEIAVRRGISIVNDVAGPLTINGNQTLLSSVFSNLIDNAVAYSGGSRITITEAARTDTAVTLIFADNGSGVPSEHLPRIFERFYRIDKGRSRAAGGTGLGLSIVKNAVLVHNGDITAENLATGGLSFRITLSVN